jgi:hypothetical protein
VFTAVPAVGAFDDSRLDGHVFAAGLWRELMPLGLIEHHHPLRVLGLELSAVLDLAVRFFSSRRFWARDTTEATAPTRSFSIFRAAVASKALTTGHRRRGHASAAAPGQARSLASTVPRRPETMEF